jgi:hypothetical protein
VTVTGEFPSLSCPLAGLDISDVELASSDTAASVRFQAE